MGPQLSEGNYTNNELNLEEYITQFEHVIAHGDVTAHAKNLDKNGHIHGKGISVETNGDVYQGNWENGIMTGKAKKIFSNGDVVNMIHINGTTYGRGKKTYENGDIYDGEWIKSRERNIMVKSGFGKMIYKDGNIYEGNWVNGVRSGHGRIHCKNGNICEGIWIDDKFIGKKMSKI